tara:strand:+ start:2042 stop:2326 length:285 start_codon:yes stop_codon:yes gene_type:complete
MEEFDYIDRYRMMNQYRKNFLDKTIEKLKKFKDEEGSDQSYEIMLQLAESILEDMDSSKGMTYHMAESKFYDEARKTVGRGILWGLIKENGSTS